jgi:hypothetical protein
MLVAHMLPGSHDAIGEMEKWKLGVPFYSLIWLVVSTEKYEFVSWEYSSQHMEKYIYM